MKDRPDSAIVPSNTQKGESAIIETFLESYDFSGKKVVAFATSGGSGLGKTESILRGVCPQAQWVPGKRLSSGADAASVEKWVKTLDI